MMVDSGSTLNANLVNAVLNEDSSTAAALLSHGADANALVQAEVMDAREGDRSWICVRRMLSEGATPLAVAAARGQIELVRLLLDRGANVNTSTLSGQTPVGLAAWAGHDETTRLLLRVGADINRGQSDEAVLITWASQGYPSLVRALLDRGAAIDARDDRGRTPLIRTVAAQRTFVPEVPPSYRDTVRLLLQRGADPNAQNKYGFTALMFVGKDAPTARLLLHHGADPQMTDHRGRSARRWAALCGSPEVREALA